MRVLKRHILQSINTINAIKGIKEPRLGSPGSYSLSEAYGGCSLHKVVNAGGGVEDVFRCGHVPKKELMYRIQAFIHGLLEPRKPNGDFRS